MCSILLQDLFIDFFRKNYLWWQICLCIADLNLASSLKTLCHFCDHNIGQVQFGNEESLMSLQKVLRLQKRKWNHPSLERQISQSAYNLPNRLFQYNVESVMIKFIQESMPGEQNTLPCLKGIRECFLEVRMPDICPSEMRRIVSVAESNWVPYL